MNLILIRHPQTVDNALRRFPGTEATPYTPRGELELNRLLGQDYPHYMIYSSAHKRCTQLAKALAERTHHKLCIDMRLREIDCGQFAHLNFDQVEQRYPEQVKAWFADAEHFCYPGGECIQAMQQRVLAFFRELKHDAIVVSHQAVLHVISTQCGDRRMFENGEMRHYEYSPHS